MGPTRLDLPLLLGTLFTEDPDRARVIGFVLHLVDGQAFALGYAATFRTPRRASWLDRHAARVCTAPSP